MRLNLQTTSFWTAVSHRISTVGIFNSNNDRSGFILDFDENICLSRFLSVDEKWLSNSKWIVSALFRLKNNKFMVPVGSLIIYEYKRLLKIVKPKIFKFEMNLWDVPECGKYVSILQTLLNGEKKTSGVKKLDFLKSMILWSWCKLQQSIGRTTSSIWRQLYESQKLRCVTFPRHEPCRSNSASCSWLIQGT